VSYILKQRAELLEIVKAIPKDTRIGLQYLGSEDAWLFLVPGEKFIWLANPIAEKLALIAEPRETSYILPKTNQRPESSIQEWMTRLAIGTTKESFSFELSQERLLEHLTKY
jgi:hypothetical protein